MPLLTRDLPTSSDEWAALREDAGLTLRDLAAVTGLHPGTIQRLEAGGSATRSTRLLIAAACGLPVFGHRNTDGG